MADQNMAAEELLLDIRVAEASRLYKFYLNQEKKILGTVAVALFLFIWELAGNTFQWVNPMFMSAPSLISPPVAPPTLSVAARGRCAELAVSARSVRRRDSAVVNMYRRERAQARVQQCHRWNAP